MSYSCYVLGKNLKKLIKCTYGALIVYKGTVIVYDPTFNTVRSADACKPEKAKGFLFASYDLSWLKKLEDDKVYELIYDDNAHLHVKDFTTGKTVMMVPGVLTPLP